MGVTLMNKTQVSATLGPLFAPAHRKTHPATSAIADEKITASGKRAKDCYFVLGLISKHNGKTTAEIAKDESDNNFNEYIRIHGKIWRRMGDLVSNGWAYEGRDKKCRVRQSKCYTCFITEEGGRILERGNDG